MERYYTQSTTNAFPVHVLPERLQRIIRELHDSNGFPADYTAASMMAAISVAIGNSHRVEVKRNWHESAILYIAIVGRPGACKSHPLAFAMRPLVNADWKNNLDYQKKYAEYQQAIAMSRKERVHAGFEQFPKEPKRLRYLVSDVTQEGLSAIHSHNPRGLCLWVDELSAWFKNFTRYNNGSEEQFWLSAFNGSTTMSDRKNSQNSIFIKRPFISVVGTIQKRLLTELANGERTANAGMKDVKNNVATEFTAMRKGISGEMAVVRKTMTTEAGNLTSAAKKISDRIDRFTANPPEQRVRHTVDKSAWQWYAVLVCSFVSVVLCAVFFLWQEGRIEQCRQSDIKYHMILMHGSIDKVGLDSIESWFQDPERVAYWEGQVRDHEQREAETARAIQNRDRLNASIQELNSAENQTSKSSNSNSKTH